jgi:tRNA dimethylallyltransferase
MSVAEAYAELASADPARAAALSPNDTTRIARSLEVVRSTGRTLAQWQGEKAGGIGDAVQLSPLILLPPREWLYERCDRRFTQMLESGAMTEVEALLARQLDPALPVMRAIGVPEIAAHLSGELTLAELEARGAQATRNYAKRQYTWFRRQPPDNWPQVETQDIACEAIFATLFQH